MKRTRVVELGLDDKEDLFDWFRRGHTAEDFRDVASKTADWVPPPASANGHNSNGREGAKPGKPIAAVREPILHDMHEIKPCPVDWLWRGYVPLGMQSELIGDPKLGKSTLTSYLAAAVSTGASLPGGGGLKEPAGVVLLSAEEDPHRVIAPRLKVMGAELSRIALLVAWDDGSDIPRVPALPFDIDILKKAIDKKDAKLLIIDPLMSYLDAEINSYKDQDVRRAVHPLKTLAEDTGVAILTVRHLNKASGGPALYRAGGSVGLSAAARSVLLLAKHPEDDDQRVLGVVAGNLAVDPVSLSFTIVGKPVPGLANEDGSPVTGATIEWGEETAHTADDLLVHRSDRSAPKLEAAKEMLQQALDGGPCLQSDLQALARDEGISWRTVLTAKAELGIESKQDRVEGHLGPSKWSLPGRGGQDGSATRDAETRSATPTHPQRCTPASADVYAGQQDSTPSVQARDATTDRDAKANCAPDKPFADGGFTL